MPQIQEIQGMHNYAIGVTHHRIASTTTQKLYAKAIYDNIADSPDELAFKKGDTLNVIEQDTDGLEGWWLCSLRGRQGICPGNRLRIINSYDSGCFSPSPSSSPCPSSLGASTVTLNSSILSSSDIYENSGFHSSSGHLSMYSNNSSSSSSGCSGSISSIPNHSHTSNFINNNTINNYYRQGKRRSWHITPHKVVTPQKCGDVYLYDILPASSNRNSSHHQNFYQNLSTIMSTEPETYDIPKPATPVNSDYPKSTPWNKPVNNKNDSNTTPIATTPTTPRPLQSEQDESYDIPRPINLLHQQNMTPSSSNSSLLTSDSLSFSLSSSNRSSLANMPDYDIPRRNPQSARLSTIKSSSSSSLAAHNNESIYDFPQSKTPLSMDKISQLVTISKELPLELSSALETLATLQNEATVSISRLLAFVNPIWRAREKLEPVLMDIKLAAVRLKTALHDLAEFGEGALANAQRADDKTLALKLRPLVKALQHSDKLLHETSHQIESQGWTVENLAREYNTKSKQVIPPDSLDQMIACAQTLIEDVRQSASFIQGNASLLFKRTQPNTPTTPSAASAIMNSEWVQDYDYVSFESKDSAAKKNSDLRDAIPNNLKKKFDNVLKSAEAQAINSDKIELDPNDKLLVKYYAVQISTHMGYLTQAIDSFLETVEKNQPPKFFIAYGKFVVLSAHNLVSIGDIVHHNIKKAELKQRIEQFTDSLAEALKSCVLKSKKAAQHFPSVQAVQEMVDSVVDISHLASDLKISMLQAVQI